MKTGVSASSFKVTTASVIKQDNTCKSKNTVCIKCIKLWSTFWNLLTILSLSGRNWHLTLGQIIITIIRLTTQIMVSSYLINQLTDGNCSHKSVRIHDFFHPIWRSAKEVHNLQFMNTWGNERWGVGWALIFHSSNTICCVNSWLLPSSLNSYTIN